MKALGLIAVGLALLVWLIPAAPMTGDGQYYIQFVRNNFQHAASSWHERRLLGPLIVRALPLDAQDGFFVLTLVSLGVTALFTWLAAREIVKEIGIYRRERTVNLGIAPYLFSKFAVLGVLCFLQSAILVVMVNAASPFHQGIFLPVLMEIYITMALTSLAGLTMGLMVSALVPNNDRAMSFIPLLLIPQVIFSGILFKLDGFAQVLGGLFA